MAIGGFGLPKTKAAWAAAKKPKKLVEPPVAKQNFVDVWLRIPVEVMQNVESIEELNILSGKIILARGLLSVANMPDAMHKHKMEKDQPVLSTRERIWKENEVLEFLHKRGVVITYRIWGEDEKQAE